MYLGVPPFGQTVRTVTEKVAVLNQVDFYPDGGYLPGYIDVQMNGQSLLSTDFFATDGIKVTLVVACSALDEFRSVAYWPVSLVDTYRKAEADARFLNLAGGSIVGGLIVGTASTNAWARLMVSGGQAGAATASIATLTPGLAQGERSDLALYSTFVGTGDSGPRRTADIISGFTSAWGTEYLAIHVGNGGSANDTKSLTTEQIRIEGGGNFKFNSGFGSVATAYPCRSWVNFNGTGTVAIQASGNVSSITDQGVGLYKVNFATAMPDANYAMSGSMEGLSGNNALVQYTDGGSGTAATTGNKGTTGCQVITSGGSLTDSAEVSVIFVR